MDAREEFERRFKKFADRYDLFPHSVELRDPEGNPGRWLAQFIVLNKTASTPTSPGHRGMDTETKYGSEEEADAAAMWLGLKWLEENAQ